MLQHILLLIENDIECPIYMLESNNYYQSLERTQGNVVQKMIKWLSTLIFPQWIVRNDRNSDCLSIYLPYGVLSFLWKQDTFLAVYCSLLNNSYLGIYLQKTTTQKTGKKELSRTRTRHRRLDGTTPNQYTTEADYLALGKSLLI